MYFLYYSFFIAGTIPDSTENQEILDSGFETGRPSPAIPNDDPLQQQQPEESRKQKVLKRLSFPLAWMESLGGTYYLHT